uniref:RNA-dependent RNA polymerase n=1 Tax=Tarumizu tick virus TaxID=2014339 RepID=A0A679C9U0_9REOV|nr:RNA-dependent RNA polymerase [Tarumizu tick virus]
MLRHAQDEWLARFDKASQVTRGLIRHVIEREVVDEDGRVKRVFDRPSGGITDVRKRLTIIDSLKVLRGLIDKWDEIQALVGRAYPFNVADLSDIMRLNELIGLSGQCHSAASVTLLRSLIYDASLDRNEGREVIPPVPTIPRELRIPPKFRYDLFYEESGSRVIKANSAEAVYIPNFRVGDVFEGKRSITSGATFEERVRHGMVTILQRMIKLRGGSIQECFMIAILSYRCSDCVEKIRLSETGVGSWVPVDHICLFRSNSLRWLATLFCDFPEFPFLMTRDGVKFAMNCGPLSSQLPLLFFQFLEQMILTTDGTYSSTIEGLLCCEWVDRARVGLFSEMFKRRKVISLLREEIFDRTRLNRYSSVGLHVYRCEAVDPKIGAKVQLNKVTLEGLDLFHPNVREALVRLITVRELSAEFGRWLAVVMKGFASALLYVSGATSLSLEQSAQGTLGHGDPLAMPIMQVEVEGVWVAVDWEYPDSDVAAMVNVGKDLCLSCEPEYANWEYGFYNVQTTNSAGNVKEAVDMRRRLLEQEVGEHAKLLVKVENTRILDCVQKISSTFTSPEGFAEGLDAPKKAGERHQVGRRPRVIQMVGTEGQLAAFVIHNVARPAYKQTRYTSSGKNSGDVRDMALVLEISGNKGYKSSLDVVGMDSSTKPVHTNITMSCVFKRLAKEYLGTPAYFLGSIPDCSDNVVRVRAREKVGMSRRWREFVYELTYPQYVLLLGVNHWTSATRFMDGYFQEFVETSRMVFRSGLLNTADQHTFIGVIMYTCLERRMKEGWYGRTKSGGRREDERRPFLEQYEKRVRLLGSVLGDDQVAGVSCPGIESEDVLDGISMDICNETKYLMERLGYACEPDVSRYSAEFLKQRGVCGAPELFPERLLLFTSERGDMAGAMPLDRTKIMLSMIDEKVGRARVTNGYYGVMLMVSWICGTASFAVSKRDQMTFRSGKSWKRVSQSSRKINRRWTVGFSVQCSEWAIWNDYGMYYREWESGGMKAIFLGMGLLWGSSDVLGIPFPLVIRGDEVLTPGTSIFTPPSNAMTHYLLRFCERDCISSRTIWNEIRNKIYSADGSENEKIIEFIDRLFSEVGLTGVPRQYLMLYRTGASIVSGSLIVPLEVWYDMTLYGRLGGFGSWIAEDIFKDIRIERQRYHLPVLEKWKDTANHLLPVDRRHSSLRAGYELRRRFGIDCPSSVLWAERPGSKIDQALFEVKRVGMEDVREMEGVFDYLHNLGDLNKRYIKRLSMGAFHVIKRLSEKKGYGINIYDSGWGHTCTPNSIEARLVGCFGFPLYHGFNYEAIRERLFIDGKLPGDPKLYVKLARQALFKSEEAYMLFSMAVGLSRRQMHDLKQIIEEGVVGLDEARFALSPRKTFLLNVSRRRGSLNFFSRCRRRSVRTFTDVIGMALLLMEPWLYSNGRWEFITSHRLRATLGRR